MNHHVNLEKNTPVQLELARTDSVIRISIAHAPEFNVLRIAWIAWIAEGQLRDLIKLLCNIGNVFIEI